MSHRRLQITIAGDSPTPERVRAPSTSPELWRKPHLDLIAADLSTTDWKRIKHKPEARQRSLNAGWESIGAGSPGRVRRCTQRNTDFALARQ
jgi:hypothetical protein